MMTKHFRLIFILLMITGSHGLYASPIKLELNKGWQFKQARLNNWHPATVPGVVHTDLLNIKSIEDPFFRLNERGLQWIDKEDWIYETAFVLPKEITEKHNIRLFFKGLDTYADVYLNGEKILEANNMFREWKTDIKKYLKSDTNRLRVYFHSPIKIDMPKWEALPYQYEAGNDQSENGGLLNRKLSVFCRKAGYHYGWDWGPRLVTSGIWRPVVIEAWDNARIENVQVIQDNISKKSASIKTIVEVSADQDTPNAKISILDGSSNQNFGTVTSNLKKGLNKIAVSFTMKNPKLWWSNGLGEPYLYNFKTDLNINGSVTDSQSDKIGIRSIKVINKPDQYGKTFYFELNGVPVFAKGANYIPCDNFLPRVTPEIYKRTILDAVNANMNMLRVWGGGTYENDIFYDLCDQYGILIWQDFMFGCSIYPAEGELLENIRQEAIDNVRRLRNHPCIAIWCGNNECNDGWFSWGWKKQYTEQNPEYAKKIYEQYCNQYYVVLPEVVNEYNPQTFYWSSSPFSEKEQASNDHSGDMHLWTVWHGKVPISTYNVAKSRFFSEYGFQSFPEFETVKRYAPEKEDWDITSDVMMAHQRGGAHANNLIQTYLLNEYHTPKDFQSFLYMNHILQGDAIKTAIEAHRRDMPYCMGTLFWQHNDCWPVASWSSRDYYGRWKAQHYYSRKAFKDVLVSPIANDSTNLLDIYVVSDRLNAFNANLTVKVMKFDGTLVSEFSKAVKIEANSSNKTLTVGIDKVLNGEKKEDVFIHASITEKGKNTYDNNYYLVKQKFLNYPKVKLTKSIKPASGGYEVSLSCDQFVRGAYMSIDGIDNFFQDNYFDILPGQTVTTFVRTATPQVEFSKQLKVISLTDAY